MNNEGVLKIFKRAFTLVSNEDTWCQGALARDENDKKVALSDPSAVKFCSLGAIAMEQTLLEEYEFLVDRLQEVGNCSIVILNDCKPREELLKVWIEVGKQIKEIK